MESIDDVAEEEGTIQAENASLSSSHSDWKSMGNFLRISLENNQSTVIPLHNEMTVQEVVENTCSKRQLDPAAYYLKLGVEDSFGSTGKLKLPFLYYKALLATQTHREPTDYEIQGFFCKQKLACSQYMGLHSSVGRALQR